MYISYYDSPIGRLMLSSDGEALTGIWIESQKYYAATAGGELEEKNDLPAFALTRDWLDRYFKGEKPSAGGLPLNPKGSPFRQEVWKILLSIPYGETLSYGEIADRISKGRQEGKTSARAVGGAVGHNPVSIIIPCHRVIGSDGSLTGFAGGLDRKVWLLSHEGAKFSDRRE